MENTLQEINETLKRIESTLEQISDDVALKTIGNKTDIVTNGRYFKNKSDTLNT